MAILVVFLIAIIIAQTIVLCWLWKERHYYGRPQPIPPVPPPKKRAEPTQSPVSLQTTNRLLNVGQFTAGLLHDLSNPLTVISLNLESLLESFPHHQDDPLSHELLTHMQHAVGQMERYLRAARTQIRGNEEIVWFEPAPEIEQVLLLLRHRAKHLDVTLQFNCDSFEMLRGSPAQFAHVVTNLVCNAIDAYDTEPRKATRNVLLTMIDRRSSTVLTVQDYGGGIAPSTLPYIFEPFFTTKTPEKGSGLGLTIIKDIIEKHFQGSITVESKLDRGTKFTVVFPKYKRRKQSPDQN